MQHGHDLHRQRPAISAFDDHSSAHGPVYVYMAVIEKKKEMSRRPDGELVSPHMRADSFVVEASDVMYSRQEL